MQPWLNTIGLALGIIRVVLIFKWGPPQPQLTEGVSIGISARNVLPSGKTVAEPDAEIRARRSLHLWRSRIGLGMILIGFVLQLIGTWP